ITGLEINIPPKGERPTMSTGKSAADAAGREAEPKTSVVIDRLDMKKATLVILPRDRAKTPLRFEIHDLKLQSAGPGGAMKYDAMPTKHRPPGKITNFRLFAL